MNVTKQLRDQFRAHDDQGNEYDVKVYVSVSSGNTTGGGTWTMDNFASAEAVALTGPNRGRPFGVRH